MTKELKSRRLDAFLTVLRRHENRHHIGLYEKFRINDPAVKLEVNWAALGSVTPAEAREFAKHLTKLARIAEEFNARNFVNNYDRDQVDLTPDDIADLIQAVNDYDIEAIMAWLEA